MNENDKKIKKQWLLMWIFSICNSAVGVFLHLRFDPSLSSLPQYAAISCFALFALILGYIFYHCAYKKSGTKLITFSLVFTALSFITNPILYLAGRLQIPTYIPYYKLYFFETQIMGVLWIIVCWRMRKLNKRVKQLSLSEKVLQSTP